MARRGQYIQKRLNQISLANDMRVWLNDQVFLTRTDGSMLGNHTFETVITPFSRWTSRPLWECWKAWDILRQSGNRKTKPGASWEIVHFKPVVANSNGDIIPQ